MEHISPIKSHEREIFMDALRGFAIFGIFIANLNSFSFYSEKATISSPFLIPDLDSKMGFLHHMLIEGKFYSIFSLLFGWGIALQIKRGLEKGVDSLPTIKRRLLFMLLLGFLHLLIWIGDIVFFYALLGFIMLPLRKLSNITLLITSGILILSPIALYGLKMIFPILNYPSEMLYTTQYFLEEKILGIVSEESFMALLHNGTWIDYLKLNFCDIFFRYGYLLYVSRIPKVLGMFMIGYVIGRTDFYKNFKHHKKLVFYIITIGLVIGLPANYILAQYMSAPNSSDYYRLKIMGWYETIAYAFGVVPLALAYVGILMFSFRNKIGHKILQLVSPVGKMAFSNYIMQTLIGNFVFLGAGLNYMGTVGPVYYTLFGFVVFLLQIIISTIWLNYFNFGPAEWIWRSLTYGKIQSMKKQTTTA